MLKKLYEKSEIWFAVVWIIAYCVLMSLGDSLSALIGVEKSVTLGVGVLLSIILILFLKRHKLFAEYGVCRPEAGAKSMLFYVPFLILLTANFWYGATFNFEALETVLYILSMFCVGFLEEVIFRGLLFNAMKKTNLKAAVIVSSLTFGIGHIINLVNGSGAELLPNILQVVYATAAGFMFVMVYHRSGSLISCILTHGVFNAVSAFANEGAATDTERIVSCVLLTVISGAYALYLTLCVKGDNRDEGATKND